MPGLRRLFRRGRRQLHSEHGAIAAIVAIVLACGLVFGMGAIVVDIGLLAVEREELQSGADAASWKIANSCASAAKTTPEYCATSAGLAAQTANLNSYARKNAKDGQADAQFCLNDTSCPWTAPMSAATACRALPTPAAGSTVGKYVEVRTTTRTTSNATLVPPIFSKLLLGDSYNGTRVGACARVSWGPPAVTKVLALGISICDFKLMTIGPNGKFYGVLGPLLNQTGLLPILGLAAPGSGDDSPIYPWGYNSCANGTPSGYAWLRNPDSSGPDSNCMINVKIGDFPKGNTLGDLLAQLLLGNDTCGSKLDSLIVARLPVLVPIYDTISGIPPAFHVIGFASFVPTGHASLGGLLMKVGSLLSDGGLNAVLTNTLCFAGNCILGYFTRTLVPTNNPQFGPTPSYDFGANIIGRTG